MTLNQVLQRIKTITLAHKQVRSFKVGLATDFFAERTTKYPAACLQYQSAAARTTGGNTYEMNFRLFLLDLVHVAEGTNDNQDDVLSDMGSVFLDLLAEMSAGNWQDWAISYDNNMQVVIEGENDLHAGWYIDFNVRTIYTQNICQVPSDLFNYPSESGGVQVFPGTDLKLVYDVTYIADGTEQNTLNVPAIVGKKVLFITRESAPIYKVSTNPDPAEYVWNDTSIQLGTVTEQNERFLILYRNY